MKLFDTKEKAVSAAKMMMITSTTMITSDYHDDDNDDHLEYVCKSTFSGENENGSKGKMISINHNPFLWIRSKFRKITTEFFFFFFVTRN